ncbi:MAG: hypothetical protein J6D57_08480 [Mogibacterium sp.]|nr:hypothetical protein [Mogibacterium sp.]
MTEPKYYQCYDLHMKNGKVLNYAEDYDIPAEKGLIGQFKRGKKRFLEYGDLLHGYTIPFDQISFIVATEVIKDM